MSETPRTDAEESNALAGIRCPDADDVESAYNWARQLERELAEAREIAQKYEDRYFAANQRIRELTEWRPMETCPPMHGERRLLLTYAGAVLVGLWHHDPSMYVVGNDYYHPDIIKGWLPLPKGNA